MTSGPGLGWMASTPPTHISRPALNHIFTMSLAVMAKWSGHLAAGGHGPRWGVIYAPGIGDEG
jgi:hypothetical protein